MVKKDLNVRDSLVREWVYHIGRQKSWTTTGGRKAKQVKVKPEPEQDLESSRSRESTRGNDVGPTDDDPVEAGDRARERSLEREEEESVSTLEEEERPTWKRFIFSPQHWETFAKYTPLIAAVFAPLATLLDIPALSQHWYDLNGVSQPDPKACIILSGVGLALNVLANALLITRFSSRARNWVRQATLWSLIFWVGKTIVAAVNLLIFGLFTRNSAGYSYAQGFWCAVVSIIDAGIISIALLLHYFIAFRKGLDTREVRTEGKKFMLSVTFFMIILAFQALAYYRIEGWTYLDSIYFSVQTALTIGYGDFAPTQTAGKVLLLPFSILTISQLGNEIALILDFFRSRAEERRDKWRARYEGAMHREANKRRPNANLMEEMALIYEINTREETMGQMYDLLWSALSLIVFWLVGAAIFSSIEGWSFGNGVYAVIVLSLTIGFGDYTPEQPASRVIFIVYSLMAVPIVTSFAVQTITGLLSTYSARSAQQESLKRQAKSFPDAFLPHSDFVLKAHDSYGDMRKTLFGRDYSIFEGLNNVVDSPRESISNGTTKIDEGGEKEKEKPITGDNVVSRPDAAPKEKDEAIPMDPMEITESPSQLEETRGEISHKADAQKPAQDQDQYQDQCHDQDQDQESMAPIVPQNTRTESILNQGGTGESHHHHHHHHHHHKNKSLKPTFTLDSLAESTKSRDSEDNQSTIQAPSNHLEHECPDRNRKGHKHFQISIGSGTDHGHKSVCEYQKPSSEMSRTEKRMKKDMERLNRLLHERAEEEEEEEEEEEGGHRPEPSPSWIEKWQSRSATRKGTSEAKGDGDGENGEAEEEEELPTHLSKTDEEAKKLEADLLKHLMDLTIKLEAESRQMLLDTMEKGIARTILLADRNVQIRDVKRLRGDDANMLAIWRGEAHQTEHDQKAINSNNQTGSSSTDLLSRVKRYRNTFAEILVVGSMLQKLEGEELERFVRVREETASTTFGGDSLPDDPRIGLPAIAKKRWDGLGSMVLKRATSNKLRGSKTV